MTAVTETNTRDVLAQIEELRREVAELRERAPEEKAAIIVFSGDLDKVLASLVVATGAAAAGLETTMFFTFWGLSALKKKSAPVGAKTLKEKMFAMMTPSSTESMGVSKLNFLGMGAVMLRTMMKEKNVSSVEEMMDLARELGVKMIGCTMSMDVMGVTREQLADDIELGGVAAFMGEAARARFSLFV